MIEGFLFCLGVVLCLWCIANWEIVLGWALILVVGAISFVAVGAVIAAVIGLWRSYGPEISEAEMSLGLWVIPLFFCVCWLWGKWQDREQS